MKLRLLFVITTSDFGGSESFLYRLVSRMDPERFDIEVCSLCPVGRTAEQIRELGIVVTSLNMHRRAKPAQMLTATFRLARLFRKSFGGRGAHGVQSLLYRANVLAAAARRLTRLAPGSAPFLVTGQRSLIPTGRSLDFRAQQLTRDWADRVVAVSKAVKQELHQTESIADEKVVVIQNGIDLEHFSPPAPGERSAARAAWGPASEYPASDDSASDNPASGNPASEDAFVIGAVGRFHGPKGLDVLIRAFAKARQTREHMWLVLAGDGPDDAALRALVDSLGLQDAVRFLGFQKDPRPLYPGFDLYVLPSLKEGSPNALLEAMGRGCACVASNVGGVPEAIIDGESGCLVPPSDPDALARVLLELADDPDRRRRLADAARERVESHFDLEQMIRAHEELYLSLGADSGA